MRLGVWATWRCRCGDCGEPEQNCPRNQIRTPHFSRPLFLLFLSSSSYPPSPGMVQSFQVERRKKWEPGRHRSLSCGWKEILCGWLAPVAPGAPVFTQVWVRLATWGTNPAKRV